LGVLGVDRGPDRFERDLQSCTRIKLVAFRDYDR